MPSQEMNYNDQDEAQLQHELSPDIAETTSSDDWSFEDDFDMEDFGPDPDEANRRMDEQLALSRAYSLINEAILEVAEARLLLAKYQRRDAALIQFIVDNEAEAFQRVWSEYMIQSIADKTEWAQDALIEGARWMEEFEIRIRNVEEWFRNERFSLEADLENLKNLMHWARFEIRRWQSGR